MFLLCHFFYCVNAFLICIYSFCVYIASWVYLSLWVYSCVYVAFSSCVYLISFMFSSCVYPFRVYVPSYICPFRYMSLPCLVSFICKPLPRIYFLLFILYYEYYWPFPSHLSVSIRLELRLPAFQTIYSYIVITTCLPTYRCLARRQISSLRLVHLAHQNRIYWQ